MKTVCRMHRTRSLIHSVAYTRFMRRYCSIFVLISCFHFLCVFSSENSRRWPNFVFFHFIWIDFASMIEISIRKIVILLEILRPAIWCVCVLHLVAISQLTHFMYNNKALCHPVFLSLCFSFCLFSVHVYKCIHQYNDLCTRTAWLRYRLG